MQISEMTAMKYEAGTEQSKSTVKSNDWIYIDILPDLWARKTCYHFGSQPHLARI